VNVDSEMSLEISNLSNFPIIQICCLALEKSKRRRIFSIILSLNEKLLLVFLLAGKIAPQMLGFDIDQK
jgi:hypothetical protein